MAVTVKKENRILTVDEQSLRSYLADGYDQVEVDEKKREYIVVKRATGGRTVSLAEHNKALEELEKLKAENKKLKAENTKSKKAE